MIPSNRTKSRLVVPEETTGLIEGPDEWLLMVEGAAVSRVERTAIVADLHLGYEWSRAAKGDMVPAHSLNETIGALDRMLRRVRVDRMVVAGDLTETARPCPRTARDVARFQAWLASRDIELIALAGNHDRPRRPPWPETIVVSGWTVGHGHRAIAGDRLIFGHHHPILRSDGLSARCFLVDERTIALPAFSRNAAGLNVGLSPLPEPLRRGTLRCVAGQGETLLDFGPLDRLRARLGGGSIGF